MKYKLIMIIILFSSMLFVGFIDNSFPLVQKTIYLDAGHGGVDKGASYDGIGESTINLSIVYKLKKLLEKNGAIVYLTRSGDYDLSLPNTSYRKRSDLKERSILINNSNADMYISIHLNAYTDFSWNGAQVFYDDINENNKYCAEVIQNSLKKSLGTTREAKLLKDQYMNSRIKLPGILIEAGFLSNSSERQKLKDSIYQDKIVNSIVNGIINFYN